tara:strand:+ start:544 stop:741 length:198 start_codon:yes stop_codon:yes gene_type:complete
MKRRLVRGDAVVLKYYCKDRDRPAIVIDKPRGGFVTIVFADANQKVTALVDNLIILNEKRNPGKT